MNGGCRLEQRIGATAPFLRPASEMDRILYSNG